VIGGNEYAGSMIVTFKDANNKTKSVVMKQGSFKVEVSLNSTVTIAITPAKGHSYEIYHGFTTLKKVGTDKYQFTVNDDKSIYLEWVK
jgi:hypothetical protein